MEVDIAEFSVYLECLKHRKVNTIEDMIVELICHNAWTPLGRVHPPTPVLLTTLMISLIMGSFYPLGFMDFFSFLSIHMHT